MSEEKQLGVFWGEKSLYFVEVSETTPSKIFSIPLPHENIGSLEEGPLSPIGMELTSSIQKAFHQHNIQAKIISLSLPTKDIIFRSFVIPWMQAHEVSNVFNFEVRKYIPFSLEELSYSFQETNIVEEGTRRIRIVFAAIKKSGLANYVQLLEQLAVQINVMEPSPSSLIRVLAFKNLFPEDEVVALVEEEGDIGRIMIVIKGMPQFVREFKIKSLPATQNEIRISLDYFNRQDRQSQVQKIIFLAMTGSDELSKGLEADLGISAKKINVLEVFENDQHKEAGFFSAYGTGLFTSLGSVTDFNFSEKKEKKKAPLAKLAVPKDIDYKQILKVAGMCVFVIIGSLLLSFLLLLGNTKKIAELKKSMVGFEEVSAPLLKVKKEKLDKKLKNIENLRTETNVAFFLAAIPELLPKGTWIKNFSIVYESSAPKDGLKRGRKKKKSKKKKTAIPERQKTKPVILLEGYVYLKNVREQFGRVNKVIRNLKSNERFSKFFNNIKLETVKNEKLEGHSVASFVIKCQ